MGSPGYGGEAMESSGRSTEGTQTPISFAEDGPELERLTKVRQVPQPIFLRCVQSQMRPSALSSAPGCRNLEAMMML